eukprot:scaffold72004_cov14-Tisochrysis_lutea.AAC.1
MGEIRQSAARTGARAAAPRVSELIEDEEPQKPLVSLEALAVMLSADVSSPKELSLHSFMAAQGCIVSLDSVLLLT